MGLDITAYDKDNKVISELRIPHWDRQANEIWKRTAPKYGVSGEIKEIDIVYALFEFLQWHTDDDPFDYHIEEIKEFYKQCLNENAKYIEVI